MPAGQNPTQNQEQFRSMVAGVQDYAIFLLSPEGIVLSWNAGAELIKDIAPKKSSASTFPFFIHRTRSIKAGPNSS